METLKPVKPEFIAPMLEPLYRNTDTLYRIDGYGERFYYRITDSNQVLFYGSVTSLKKQVTPMAQPIIDKMIELGRDFDDYRNNKAHFGTFMHIQLAELTIYGKYDMTQIEPRIADYAAEHKDTGDTSWWFQSCWKGLLSWAQTMQDYDIRPKAVEIPLWHPEGFAGTLDLVCSMYAEKYTEKTPLDKRIRVLAIIDWKTGGIYDDHAVQLELCKRLWQFHFPADPIALLFNWSPNDWRTKPGYELRNQTDKEDSVDLLIALWKKKGLKKPGDKRTLIADSISTNMDLTTTWKVKEIEEIILERHGAEVVA